MTEPLMQLPVLGFAGMLGLFALIMLFVSVEEALRS
jgi:hypothetical protein